MHRFCRLILVVSALFSFFACSSDSGGSGFVLNPQETFTDEDQPESFTSGSLTFSSPWGYDRPANAPPASIRS